MSKTDWFFIGIYGVFAFFLAIKGVVWVTKRVREMINDYDNFWRGFSRMFAGNDQR